MLKELVCSSKKFGIEPAKFLSWGNVRSAYFRKMIVRTNVKSAQEMEMGREKPGRGVGDSLV